MKHLSLSLCTMLIAIAGTACQSGDVSQRTDFSDRSFSPTPNLHEKALEIQRGNPDVSYGTALKIAERRFSLKDAKSLKKIKAQNERDAFRKDLAKVLGDP
ncbi:MAG: hypothetical protein SynsKO_29040 [Synoicihabitans sp.]